RPEWAGVLPLRIHDFVPFADRNPTILARGNAGTLIGFLEPWHHSGRFRSMAVARFIVVRQSAIKRVLARREFRRNVIVPVRFLRIVEPAVVFRPVRVPRAGAIRYGIVRGWLFADPKNRGDDV